MNYRGWNIFYAHVRGWIAVKHGVRISGNSKSDLKRAIDLRAEVGGNIVK